ncbi:MAG: zinc-ribbon domain containing protein [Isosphaeraceae bacterium]|nr:zinc-ribbon domain containing protein [Isosphaeraceae bacterium]
MSESGSDRQRNVVPHPRFGDQSVPSGYRVPFELIRACYCYDRPPVFPESAIPADISRQNFSVRPRYCYVDMLKGCRKCGRDFIFFAREQQYWYEELGFWVDADCVHCPECRRSNQHLRQRLKRFSHTMGRDAIGNEELATLVEDAVYLFEAGVLRNEQKLRRLKNLAATSIPESAARQAIEELVSKIESGRGTVL